ncbi:MAG: outer membrane beta-barrel protein [Chitinophagaceae bacterium]
MQENEFEKRMRQEMGEFRLRPSDAVWEKVKAQLKKKKRRRVVFFIFMLAGLSLLGYSGYFLTKTNSKQNIVQQDNNSLPNNNKSEPGGNQQSLRVIAKETDRDHSAIRENSLSQTKENDQDEKLRNIINNDKAIIGGNNNDAEHKEKIKKISSANYVIAKSATKSDVTITNDTHQQKKDKAPLQSSPLNQPLDRADISKTDIAKNISTDDNKIADPKSDSKSIDEKINETLKPDSAITAQSKADEVIAAAKKKQPLSKIKWSVDVSAGITANRANAFSIFNLNSDKSLLMDVYAPGNSTGGGGLPGYTRVSPSDIKAGPAFRAGLLAEKEISKRSSISSGLQYVYYSNGIQVGYYSDTTVVVNNSFSQDSRVAAIYRGSHQKEYTNRYHFIQIPLQYQWRLNKGDKLPIVWNVGASAGYLFATNGLVYDTTAGGIYYRDNAAFNKFRFNLNTGLSFRFGDKNKVQWALGPELSLGMNKLMKDDYTKKQYLLYGGLTGRLYFKKRNTK